MQDEERVAFRFFEFFGEFVARYLSWFKKFRQLRDVKKTHRALIDVLPNFVGRCSDENVAGSLVEEIYLALGTVPGRGYEQLHPTCQCVFSLSS